MEISRILGRSLSAGRTQLLSSIIEPDCHQNKSQIQFIIKKVPLAHKILVQDYQVRAKITHPNVPFLKIENNSKFYLTICAQKTKPFCAKDLLTISFQVKSKLLLDILNAVSFLSKHFGFFYITQKMLGYDAQGKIKIWINDDVLQNRRKCPINHGRLSQQIFVADFKQYFGENFRTLREFYEAKNINSLINLMQKGQSIYQSIYISEPIQKNSLILRNKETTTSYDGQIFSKFIKQRGFAKEQTSSNNYTLNSVLKRQISISYLPVNQSQIVNQPPKKLMRMLSDPVSFRHSINTSQSSLVNIDRNFSTQQSLISNSSCSNLVRKNVLTQSSLPKIQFNYNLHKQAWKKKKREVTKKSLVTESYNSLSRSTSANNLYRNSFKQSFHEPLKTSFPHTTTHTFTPFASNGNISLHFNENVAEKKQVAHVKEQEINNPAFEQHISEQSNEVEMDLDCLFSDSGNDIHSRQQMENLEVLVQQFQNILLA